MLPDADVKIFLTADSAERAWRRAAENETGSDAAARPDTVARTAESIRRRDELDSTRAASPLVTPEGAFVLDSTGRSIESVVEEVISQL